MADPPCSVTLDQSLNPAGPQFSPFRRTVHKHVFLVGFETTQCIRPRKAPGTGRDPSESAVSVGLAPSSSSSEGPHRWTESLHHRIPVFFLGSFFGSEDTVAGHTSEGHRAGRILVVCGRDEGIPWQRLPTYRNSERSRGGAGRETITEDLERSMGFRFPLRAPVPLTPARPKGAFSFQCQPEQERLRPR